MTEKISKPLLTASAALVISIAIVALGFFLEWLFLGP
jgi:hypothetical protein